MAKGAYIFVVSFSDQLPHFFKIIKMWKTFYFNSQEKICEIFCINRFIFNFIWNILCIEYLINIYFFFLFFINLVLFL
jgi:hypothetical protein